MEDVEELNNDEKTMQAEGDSIYVYSRGCGGLWY